MGVEIWIEMFVCVMAGLLANFTIVSFIAFVLNFQIPYLLSGTVDHHTSYGNDNSPFLSLTANLLLLLGFGLQHSGLAQWPIKSLLRRIFSTTNVMVFQGTVASLYVNCLLFLWTPLPYTLWDVQWKELRIILHALSLLSLFGMILTMMGVDALTQLGIRTHVDKLLNREPFKAKLRTCGMYALMRHPAFSCFMLVLWITPTMTIGHFIFASVFSGYITLAVAHFQEPKLVKKFGSEYLKYAKITPRYIPSFKSFTAALNAKKTE